MRRIALDAAVGLALWAGAAVWGTYYWSASLAAGRQPIFYQEYFEPAVMLACGKGFVLAAPTQLPAMRAFLLRTVDRFSCDQLPADLQVTTRGRYQITWIYLMATVSAAWKLLGISWSGLAPLFGLLFGTVIALAYGIFRLALGRLLGVLCALSLSVSTLHLLNLPHLRDYAKAPFTLALVLVLGWLVTWPIKRSTVLGLSAAYGIILGLGYGFRTDLLVNIPPLLVVLFCFLPGPLLGHLKLKIGAAALFTLGFVLVGWPVLSFVLRSGGCQWHVILLGLTTWFNDQLGVGGSLYDWGHNYADSFIYQTVANYASRVQPGVGPIEYCSHEYDQVCARYLSEIVRNFPADMLTRAYASVLQIVDLPFPWIDPPMSQHAGFFYSLRAATFKVMAGTGVVTAAAALVIISAASLRLALFGLFFLLYFGGYPALQFQNRHYFHLEFIGWLGLGLVIQQVVRLLAGLTRDDRRRAVVAAVRRPRGWWNATTRRVAVFAAAACLAIVGPLIALRQYQHAHVGRLLDAYIAAPRERIDAAGWSSDSTNSSLGQAAGTRAGRTQAWGQYLEVDLNTRRCDAESSVTFRYDRAHPDTDYSRTKTLGRVPEAQELTRILAPVYADFKGLEFSNMGPGCLGGVYRFTNPEKFPLLLFATLSPGWRKAPLHQRIKEWETGQ